MNSSLRRILFCLIGAAFLGLLGRGFAGLEPFGRYPGPYGDILNAIAPPQRHVLNVVTAVNFDFRGFDTLGEEFILFASVAGVMLLLRHESGKNDGKDTPAPVHGPHEEMIDAKPSDLTQFGGLIFVAAILIFGSYIVLTGHLSVGGGFQGGVILAGAWLLAFLALGSKLFHHFSQPYILEWFEAAGAGAYAIIGLAPLFFGMNFLTNILPLGRTGQLFSSGGIFLINCAVGIEVAAAFVLLIKEFLRPLEKEHPLRNL